MYSTPNLCTHARVHIHSLAQATKTNHMTMCSVVFNIYIHPIDRKRLVNLTVNLREQVHLPLFYFVDAWQEQE